MGTLSESESVVGISLYCFLYIIENGRVYCFYIRFKEQSSEYNRRIEYRKLINEKYLNLLNNLKMWLFTL